MIAALLFLQTAVAQPTLMVRDGSDQVVVPVTVSLGEATVRADLLMSAMKGALVTVSNQRFALILPRGRLELVDGIPFARLDTLMIPLFRPPLLRGGYLHLPYQLVSEIIPRYGGGYFYDRAGRELRTFTTVARRAPAQNPIAAPPPVRQPAAPPRGKRVVVIDPGHGGRDQGMSGPIGSSPWFVEKE